MKVKKVYKKVEDFLRDDEFIKTVLSSSSLSVPYLEKLRKENSGCNSLINVAISILRAELPEVMGETSVFIGAWFAAMAGRPCPWQMVFSLEML